MTAHLIACLDCGGFHPIDQHTRPGAEPVRPNPAQGELFSFGRVELIEEPGDDSRDTYENRWFSE
jgi:hypothetical protein